MKENIIIMQPFGIGDILFISPIISKLDYDVIWPVNDEYIWIKDYLVLPNTTFIEMSKYRNEPIYSLVEKIDFLNAENILRSMGIKLDCMGAKYHYVSEDISEWKTLKWNRNYDKENVSGIQKIVDIITDLEESQDGLEKFLEPINKNIEKLLIEEKDLYDKICQKHSNYTEEQIVNFVKMRLEKENLL